MKLTLISLLFASVVSNASALQVKVFCVGDGGADNGTPCRQIRQRKAGECGNQQVDVSATWKNTCGKTVTIERESFLKLDGGAATSVNNGSPQFRSIPAIKLRPGQEEDGQFSFTINTCKQDFKVELNIKTKEQPGKCRGYFFQRYMKTLCRVSGEIGCTLGDGTNCVSYTGPKFKEIPATDQCPAIKCVDQTPESCRQDIKYDFKVTNKVSDQTVKFDLTSPEIANSKVAWRIVEPNNRNFAPLNPRNNPREWTVTKQNVNVCRVIPMASVNILGNIFVGNNKDPNYAFCFDYTQKKVQKFDQENGKKYPFCQDIGPVPAPTPCPPVGKGSDSKGKGKGKTPPPKPCTCPGVLPNSPSAPRDEL